MSAALRAWPTNVAYENRRILAWRRPAGFFQLREQRYDWLNKLFIELCEGGRGFMLHFTKAVVFFGTG